MFITYIIATFIVTYALIMTQPGYECYINNDNYNMNYELELKRNVPVQRQIFSALPWNCYNYNIMSLPILPPGLSTNELTTSIQTIPYIEGTVTDYFPTTKIQVYLQCLGEIQFRCGVITMKSLLTVVILIQILTHS